MGVTATSTAPTPATLGQLRAAGHEIQSLREEIRANLLARLRAGEDPWPGLHGFSETVIPQVERALLAGHDVVLLGERGQGKTRLLRALVGLLDEWSPVIEGSELGEHPYEPIAPESIRRAQEMGEELPITWRHRDQRYAEKLATPDTSVADLIGDVDPMKVIQVAMLNVMEERDIQIRGYVLRLPLDVLVVASANPEDYTNRGRIITPLKDRFGAEIRTHYPREVSQEVAVIAQEADLVAQVPDHLLEVLARFTRQLRGSASIDQRSGVSARFAIAGAETIAAAALRRATVLGEDAAVAFHQHPGEGGGEAGILQRDDGDHLEGFEAGATITTGVSVSARDFLAGLPVLGESELYDQITDRLGAHDDGSRAGAIELALEGLFLARKIGKDTAGTQTVYG